MIRRYSFTILLAFFFLKGFAQQDPLQVEFEPAASPVIGQSYDVDVNVSDFDQLFGAQFAIVWDSLVLEIDTVVNLSADLVDFNLAAFTFPSQTQNKLKGRVRLSWFFGGSPQSLPQDHHLFTLRFNVIGDPCDETTLGLMDLPSVPIEISNANFDNIGATWEDINVVIPGAGCDASNDIELVFGNLSAVMGSNICIPFTVNNFDSIETFQGSFMWDPAVLTYTGVQNFGLPGLSSGFFNTNNAGNGVISFLWFDSSGTSPVSLSNGSTVFEICFDVIGNDGQSSVVKPFNGTVPIQISSPAPKGVRGFTITNGRITVGIPRGEFSIVAENVTVNGAQTEVCVDFSTINFIKIAGMQYTMQWDPLVLAYNRVETTNSEFASAFSPTNNDKLRYSWTHSQGSGLDQADGTVIYTVCFDILGDCDDTTPISFISEVGRAIEITDNSFTSLPDNVVNMQDGSVTISCGIDCTANITNVRCNGDSNGAINLVITGGESPYDVLWNGTEMQMNITTSTLLVGQEAGSFTAVVTDASGNTATCGVYEIVEPDSIVLTVQVNAMAITASAVGGNSTPVITYSPAIADINNVAPGTYTATATDNRSCTDSVIFTVAGDCNISSDITIFSATCGADGRILVTCSGGSGTYIVTSSPTLSYDNGVFMNVPAGTYEITCQDANDASCTFTDNVTVLMSTPPTLNAVVSNVTSAQCNGPGGTFDVAVSGGCPGYSIVVINAGGTQTTYMPGATFPAGSYTVRVTDLGGNRVDIPVVITMSAGVPLVISSHVVTPSPCTGMLGEATFIITGGCGMTTCQIALNNGAPQACSLVVNSDGSLTGSFPQGTHTITITDSFGSSDSQTFTITAGSNPVIVTVVSITNDAIDINVSGGEAPYTYQWFFNNNLIATTQDVTGITGPGTCTVLVVDNNGCSASLEVVKPNGGFSVVVDPVQTLFGGFATPCAEGDCRGEISGLIVGGLAPYTITLTNESAVDFVFTFNQAGDYSIPNLCAGNYQVVGADGNGEVVNVQEAVEITSPPALSILEDDLNCPTDGQNNGSISAIVSGGAGGLIYTWIPQTSDPIPGPSNENLDVGMYTLQVEDINGCEAQMTFNLLTICQEDCFQGRRVITPNGDGSNDELIINCSDNASIRIFDRWSRLIYNANNYDNNWSGLDNDNIELPEGAYYWILKTASDTYNGTVTLLRN